jgi:hypothetical protein
MTYATPIRRVSRKLRVFSLCVLLPMVACNRAPSTLVVTHEASPAGQKSVLPQVTTLSDGRIAASWLEPMDQGGYAFKLSTRQGQTWSDARTIASGKELVMFSADLPGVVEMEPGRLLAYWQRFDRTGSDPYATAIQLAQSTDDGKQWTEPIVPHTDAVSGSHSFLAAFPVGGRAGVVWLDAKHQQYTAPSAADSKGAWMGAMGLRYSSIDRTGQLHDDQFLDPIVCDCCPNASTVTAKGPLVAFRDRAAASDARPEAVGPDAGTVRDIFVTRLEAAGWSTPVRVHADEWVINACPDNGPALDAEQDDAVIAWWTMAGGDPSVKVAFSKDSGGSWGKPTRVDHGKGNGQVTVALLSDGRSAMVGWLEDRQTWARIVRADGTTSEPVSLGKSPSRNRLPHWVSTREGVLALWTRDDSGASSTQVSLLRLND